MSDRCFVLRGYLDGSGKSNSSEYVTLTSLIASESVWHQFECSWREVLRVHGISDFHTNEAMSLNGRFSHAHGWNRDRLQTLTTDLWNVIGRYRWISNSSPQSNLNARSCTVVMRDYQRAKLERPTLREPEALCTGYCLHRFPVDLDSQIEHPEIILKFDRNEDFLKTVYRGWVRFKNKPDTGRPKQIRDISTCVAAKEYPLQATDLVAWTVNKDHKTADGYPLAVGLAIMLSHQQKLFDYETIMATPDALVCFS